MHNFFDDDDYETFNDDADFAKITVSLDSNHFKDEVEDTNLGQAWGGKAYSLKGWLF